MVISFLVLMVYLFKFIIIIIITITITNFQNCRLCYPGWPQNKTERMWKCWMSSSKLVTELKKLGNMKVTVVPIVIGAFGTVTKGLLKALEDLNVDGREETIPNNNIIGNGQNTEKSPGDLRRLAVTQTPVKNHQLTLIWKTLKE